MNLTNAQRRHLLEECATAAEAFAAEVARVATFDPVEVSDYPPAAECQRETARELIELVAAVTLAHEFGALPEELHTAAGIYSAKRRLLAKVLGTQ